MKVSIRRFFFKIGGPALVVGAICTMEVSSWQGWRLHNPGLVLLPLTIGATLVAGLGSGLTAAFVSIVYFAYLNQIPGEEWFGGMAPRGWTSIVAVSLIVPLAEMVRRRFGRESDERFRAMADNIAQFAWMADAEGRIFWFNQRWFEYTGATEKEMTGFGWHQFIRPDHRERVVTQSRACFEKEELWEDTFPLRSKNGSYHWFLTRAVPVRDKRGRVQRWFGTNTDVNVQLEVEQKLLKVKSTLEERVAKGAVVSEGRAVQLRALAMELIETEKRERRRLAEVLHDDLQQLLVAARMQLDSAGRPGNLAERTAAAQNLITQAIEAARSLSKELAPPVLYEHGLSAGIRWLAASAGERYGFEIEVTATESGEVEGEWLRTFLYGIVRELLLNVAKHAATDRVLISLTRGGGELNIVVEDFGKGFSIDATKSGGGGSGLFFMQERVKLIGGVVDIASAPGKGTRVELKVPLSDVPQRQT